jgi:hypothetical protein
MWLKQVLQAVEHLMHTSGCRRGCKQVIQDLGYRSRTADCSVQAAESHTQRQWGVNFLRVNEVVHVHHPGGRAALAGTRMVIRDGPGMPSGRELTGRARGRILAERPRVADYAGTWLASCGLIAVCCSKTGGDCDQHPSVLAGATADPQPIGNRFVWQGSARIVRRPLRRLMKLLRHRDAGRSPATLGGSEAAGLLAAEACHASTDMQSCSLVQIAA